MALDCLLTSLFSHTLSQLAGIASLAGVVIFVFLVIIVVSVFRNYKKLNSNSQFMVLLFAMSMLVNTILFIFVAGTFVPRFYMLSLILIAPCIAIFLDSEHIIKYDFNKCVAIVLAIVLNISGISACCNCISVKTNDPLKNTVEFMLENSLTFGLTTFWNTGVPTEISNGQIELVNIQEDDITNLSSWLTSKDYEHSKTWQNIESDSIFVLLDSSVYERYADHPMLCDGNLVYDENGFDIVVFEKNHFIEMYGSQYYTD